MLKNLSIRMGLLAVLVAMMLLLLLVSGIGIKKRINSKK